MIYAYDSSGHGNDDEKVNYIAAITGEAIKPRKGWYITNWGPLPGVQITPKILQSQRFI